MLPFTKRPGRDESGEEDVLTKDDLVVPAAAAPATKTKAGRPKFPSLNDEDMTTLMASKSLGDARPSVRPAAGSPSSPRSAPAGNSSSPGGAPSSRPAKFSKQDDEEEGRTIVRGAPKIVKRNAAASAGNKMGMPTSPTTISPAAVIKATLESARAGAKPRTGGDHLMAGPPQDLLEDLADRHASQRPPEPHPADVGAEHTAILQSPSVAPPGMIQGVKALSTQMLQPQALPQGTIPPGSARPMSVPPPPNSQSGGYATQSGGYATQSGGYATQSGGYATQSGGYASQSGGYASQSGGYAQLNGPVPSGSVSVPGVSMPASMPAHFMVPQPPYSDGRMDPPGTALTARGKNAGRSGMSWAMALAAFGLFVGVGAVAVMNGNADGVVETSASFVDPSRAGGGKAAAAQAAAQAAAPTAVPTGVPVATDPPAAVGVPPVAVPATPPPPVAAATAPAVATVPAVTAPPTSPAPVAAAPAAAPVAVAAVTAKPAAPVAAAPPPRSAPVAAAPVSRPVRQAPAAAEEPAAAAPKPAKPAKGGKGGEVDDETKKALDELQKAQLERSF